MTERTTTDLLPLVEMLVEDHNNLPGLPRYNDPNFVFVEKGAADSHYYDAFSPLLVDNGDGTFSISDTQVLACRMPLPGAEPTITLARMPLNLSAPMRKVAKVSVEVDTHEVGND